MSTNNYCLSPDNETIHDHLGNTQSWGVNEIALYSCEVAQGVGRDFVYQLTDGRDSSGRNDNSPTLTAHP